MQWTYRLRVRAIELVASVAAHVHQSNITQHPQVLRDRGLRQLESDHDLLDRAFAGGQVLEDLAPARLSDRVERIGCGRCPCHGSNNTYPYGNMSNGHF